MSALLCRRCAVSALPVRVNGIHTDPPGWSCITITGRPMLSRTLCPRCTDDVRRLLEISPETLQAEFDSERQLAFTRGYEDGQADALRAAAREVPA